MECGLCIYLAGQYIRMLASKGLLTQEEMYAALDVLSECEYIAAA
jgi:hypothetical protein